MFFQQRPLTLLGDYMRGALAPLVADVVCLSANSGHGHIKVADALRHSLEQKSEGHSVGHAEVLQLSKAFYALGYNNLVVHLVKNHPEVYGALFRFFDKSGFSNTQVGHLLDKFSTEAWRSALVYRNPKAIVCTHYLPTQVAARLKAQGKITSQVNVVITDYEAHQQWIAPGVDRYFVASEAIKQKLIANGVDENKISITGIPVAESFVAARNLSRPEARDQAGLDKDGRYVLMAGGGLGLGVAPERIKEFLDQSELPEDVKLVVMCGNSKESKGQLDGLMSENSRLKGRIIIKEYLPSEQVATLMRACDLMIGKAGGGQVTEALAVGLPMVLTPLPGQEVGNAKFVRDEGAGVWVKSIEAGFDEAAKLLKGGGSEGLSKMSENARNCGDQFVAATNEITKAILAQVNKPTD